MTDFTHFHMHVLFYRANLFNRYIENWTNSWSRMISENRWLGFIKIVVPHHLMTSRLLTDSPLFLSSYILYIVHTYYSILSTRFRSLRWPVYLFLKGYVNLFTFYPHVLKRRYKCRYMFLRQTSQYIVPCVWPSLPLRVVEYKLPLPLEYCVC